LASRRFTSGGGRAKDSCERMFDKFTILCRVVGYAELHCHSNFSFLDGASYPEELVSQAARLELEALALTDHDGLYGVVRFAEAAKEGGVPTVFGAELTLADRAVAPAAPAGPRTRVADPPGSHLVALARDPEGYSRLARAISEGHLAGGEKGRPRHDLDRLAELAEGHFLILTGCRKGAVPAALVEAGPAAAARELDWLVERFGRENVVVELFDHDDPLDSARNDALAALAVRSGLGIVATNVVHYALPAGRRLASVLASVRSGRALDELDGWLPAAGAAYLRSGAEQSRRFARYPGAVELAAELGRACAFDLHLVAPKLPDFPVPAGHSEVTFLRRLVEEGAVRRYGPPGAERVPGAWRQLEHELSMIEELGFAGYFLVVWDIVEFCRRSGIYCQGRGSAASSAVCYVLGITNADAVALGLLFERFLSPERDGPPDIDVDIESGRREDVIQYVYGRYGRERAALVAVVVSYRARSSVRDAAKALGHSPGQVDAWAKRIERWGSLGGAHHPSALHRKDRWTWWSAAAEGEAARRAAAEATIGNRSPDTHDHPGRDDVAAEPGPEQVASDLGIPVQVLAVATELEGFPRHLGIHPGGMVICDRPVSEVCPVEWARMENRTVLQWDKDDCAAVGLVKFDLLGLGMLEAIHRAVDTIGAYHHDEIDLAVIPQEEAVYDMLCRGDSVGLFQVESRAQMATLPRLRPRCFYDLVVEVALIRPGPIQGGSVHPYLRRRNGAEAVKYLHPCFERSLAKTLGVPLFQEQLMQMAIDAAGFSAAEADQLRQAMGSKRSASRMERLRARLYAGMAERGITGQVADTIWEQLAAFANFGFPESHSVSFAYLVYVSAWLKLHYPAAFLTSLLNSQPMGFWAPHTLVADARRHGVVVAGPDVNKSEALSSLDPAPGDGGPVVRLGLASVKGVGDDLATEIATGRPYVDMEDLVRRSGIGRPALEALATSGALAGLGGAAARADTAAAKSGEAAGTRPFGRREALWVAGAAAEARPNRLPGTVVGTKAPPLPEMDEIEEMSADLQTLGLSPGSEPMAFAREALASRGVTPNAELVRVPDGAKVLVAGVVTHRQRPATAGGTTFLNLEDETGLVNVICSPGCWVRYRKAARSAVVLLVRGRLERGEGADPAAPSSANVVAEYLEEIDFAFALRPSRDFH